MLRIDIACAHTQAADTMLTQELTNPTQASKWKNQKNPGRLD
jgi:hypothetical protein